MGAGYITLNGSPINGWTDNVLRGCGKMEEIWRKVERMKIFQRKTLYLNGIWQITP